MFQEFVLAQQAIYTFMASSGERTLREFVSPRLGGFDVITASTRLFTRISDGAKEGIPLELPGFHDPVGRVSDAAGKRGYQYTEDNVVKYMKVAASKR